MRVVLRSWHLKYGAWSDYSGEHRTLVLQDLTQLQEVMDQAIADWTEQEVFNQDDKYDGGVVVHLEGADPFDLSVAIAKKVAPNPWWAANPEG